MRKTEVTGQQTMKRYVIGVDFGTLSARAVLVDPKDGREVAEAVSVYPHGVMDEFLPDGRKLPPQFALQHPADYLRALRETVPKVLEKAGADGRDIAALGIDFTACTLLPVDRDGTPLCFSDAWAHEPHAFPC